MVALLGDDEPSHAYVGIAIGAAAAVTETRKEINAERWNLPRQLTSLEILTSLFFVFLCVSLCSFFSVAYHNFCHREVLPLSFAQSYGMSMEWRQEGEANGAHGRAVTTLLCFSSNKKKL